MFTQRSSFMLVLAFGILLIFQTYSISLIYNKNRSTITVFTPAHQPLVLQIDYTSSDIHLANSYQNQFDFVYLSKHNKNKLLLNPHSSHNHNHQKDQKLSKQLLYDFQQKQVQFIDGQVIRINGKVGFKPLSNNTFLQLIRLSAHKEQAKLVYRGEKQSLDVVYQDCRNIVKFPISVELFYEGRQRTILIREMSEKLIIDKGIVGLLFKQQNESVVTIQTQDMQNKQIKVTINGKSKTILLADLIKPYCHKRVHTHNYSCDFRHIQKEIPQMGGLLIMLFDFTICSKGIQIINNNSQKEKETYYFLHCILLFLIMVACLIYHQNQIVVKWIKRILIKWKSY